LILRKLAALDINLPVSAPLAVKIRLA